MPFTFREPVKTEQGEFPFAAITMIVAPAWRDTEIEANVTLLLQPYRVAKDGRIERPTERTVAEHEDGSTEEIEAVRIDLDQRIVLSCAYEAAAKDESLANAMHAIATAVQRFIMEKF